MNRAHRSVLHRLCFIGVLSLFAQGALADVPLASREADRQVKAAAPEAGEAFIYVYRVADSDGSPLAVKLWGRETVRLAPRTFAFWRVKPGRRELGVERSASTLPLACEDGRVYYVELARSISGIPVLRPVSFAQGRSEVHRSQLVAQAAASDPAGASTSRRGDRAVTGAVMLKLGSFTLADDTQTILSSSRRFDDSASVVALEGEWFLRPDVSLGAELLRYSNDYTTPPSAGLNGEVQTTVFLINLKRYFLPDSEWQPYVGIGAGGAGTDLSGAITGDTAGTALQLVGGVQWRSGAFALRGEYKFLHANTEDDNGNEVDVSGSGIFLGAGFYF